MNVLAIVDAISWTLLHFLWQAAIVALVLALLLRLFRARYAASSLAMLSLPLLAAATLLIQLGVFTSAPAPTQQPAAAPPLAASTASREAAPPTLSTMHSATAQSLAPTASSPPAIPGAPYSAATPAISPHWLARWQSWLVSAWLCGTALLCLRFLFRWQAVRRIRHVALPLPQDSPWPERLLVLAKRISATSTVRLLTSTRIDVPIAIGVLRPLIVVPVSMFSTLTPDQVDAILLHELAHIRRHDFLVNLLQSVVETVFFFHPAVWWISSRMRLHREFCCDDIASAACRDRSQYAWALTALEESRGRAHLALASAADGNRRGNLLGRIERLVGGNRDPQRASAWELLAVALLLAASATALVTLGVGFPAKAGDEPSPAATGQKTPPATPGAPAASAPVPSNRHFLNVVGENGKPAAHNGVVAARVGFPLDGDLQWSAQRDRDGLVSLAGLPDGLHTLILAPEFSNRTVFTLTLPAEKRVIDAPLRSMEEWRSTELSLNASFDPLPQRDAVVRLRIANNTRQTLRITERDICLEAGTKDTRHFGLSPAWRKKDADELPVTKIEQGQTGEMEFKWSDWIRDGLWFNDRSYPRVEIGPALPDAKQGHISVRVWVRSHGLLPITLPHPSLLAPRAAAQAPQHAPTGPAAADEDIDPLTKQLFREYVVRNGKISTNRVAAAIELVAARSRGNARFQETVIEEFEKSCQDKDSSTVRRNLLKLMRKMLAAEGALRWHYERPQDGEPFAAAVSPPIPADPKVLYADSKMLACILARGRQSDRSDIDSYVLAIRAAHHPQGKQFLLDVLQNPESTDPFDANDPDVNQGKWPDNLGGSWRDAKFHAAVALAELGEPDGVQWLIAKAKPNDFGLDGSVFRVPHARSASGSLRESCRYALADLSGIQPDGDADRWSTWWAENKAKFVPQPITLRLD